MGDFYHLIAPTVWSVKNDLVRFNRSFYRKTLLYAAFSAFFIFLITDLLTKGLSRAERLIVVLYYYEEMTMKEIGATLDLSESRVSQMHSSIVARLKAQLNTRKREFSVHT